MRYLLDTNVLIERARSRPATKVKAWIDSLVPAQIVLCPIVAAEFMVGVFKLPPGQRQDGVRFLREAIRAFCWQPVDLRAAIAYGQTRARLKIKGRVNDLWLASLALAHNLTIATRNEKHLKPFGARTFNPF